MDSFAYSPDILGKINKVCKDPSVEIFNSHPDQDLIIDDIEKTLASIYSFVADSFTDLGAIEYILKVDFKNAITSANSLDATFVLQERLNNKNFFEIDKNLAIANSTKFHDISDTKLCKFSRDNDCTLLLILNGNDTKIYSKGCIIGEINARNPDAEPPINKKTNRSARDYKLSILDFYDLRIRNNITKHWQDAPKRVLIGGKTEDCFQFGLTNWLQENINAAKVIPKVKKTSQDETDIEIIEHGGNSYLIEIKWMGTNSSNTTYGELKVRDAIYQVKNYLTTDKELLEATIVVYDGRKIDEFNKITSINEMAGNWKELNECMAETLPLKGKAFVFYLISDPASARKPF